MISHLVGQSVVKKVLLNGLVILVRSVDNVPKVSTQLWYHVGSKNELVGEKGNAHLIEHMIFKGTEKLSETDWPAVAHKLSGMTNAFTSYDYTAYVFDFPSHHWKESLNLLSDTMRNCRFEEQMLNSELKAVIQELKLMKDNYFKILWQAMVSAIFIDHPYHYPVIGFKQDLWNLDRDDLFNFYHKHYVPNNATLVVVGDVKPEEVFAEAEKAFGHLKKALSYTHKEFYIGKDLMSQSVVVYRDVQQPYGLFAFVFPGAKENKRYETDVLSSLLGGGKSSRLTKKLVDELQLVTEFSTFPLYLEDATVFLFYFCAKDESTIEEIRAIVNAEIHDIVKNGIPERELLKAIKQVKVGLLSSLESNYSQATMIGESYLLSGDENLPFKMLANNDSSLEQNIRALLKTCATSATMHTGKLLPLTEQGKEQWKELQKLSDNEDARILNGRVRDIPIEPTSYADTVQVQKPKSFRFHKPEKYSLSNGIKVFTCTSKNIPKIEVVLTLNAQGYFDSTELPGLYTFMCQVLIEGTKKYPGHSFAQELEEYGMDLAITPGFISLSMLKEDFEKGLEFFQELIMNASFDQDAIEKVRPALLAQLKMFWDKPSSYVGQIVREHVYEGHPYSKNTMGTVESLTKINKKDLVNFYKEHFSSYKAKIAVVGDLEGCEVKKELEKYFGSWKVQEVSDPHFPKINATSGKTVTQNVNRDQVVLMFAGISITRLDPDFDKLLLFDQILGGSMDSRLFKLREQTGMFYTISGSLISGVAEEPGMVCVKTIVSLDRLEAAKTLIKDALKDMIDSITQEELDSAKQSIINSQVDTFASNARMARAFLQVDRFKLSDTYFDTRADVINIITLDDVKEAVRKVLVPEKMITVQIGRLEEQVS